MTMHASHVQRPVRVIARHDRLYFKTVLVVGAAFVGLVYTATGSVW